ncbi:MAG: hypothetical protein K6A73_04735, partial [Bacteroidales bacterium]|nr:hypothetical protein [Bacteroidales bacterium]
MASNNIVKEFDWRTRHGAMNTDSYYYNTDGSGWIPRRRYGQGAKDCWAFSVLYSVEAMVNLYFNRQINDELSVQNILSCIGGNFTYGQGYLSYEALTFAETHGIINDSCFIYESWHLPSCDHQCPNPTERVFISGHSNSITGEDNIKEQLVTKGVIVASVKKWGHAMSMVGFGVVKAGDPILYGNIHGNTDHDIYVESDSPDIGKPYYIFKQSYARYGYDNIPFCNVIVNANNTMYLWRCFSIDTPITSILYNDNDILCIDYDGDGYYNWGIGPKPLTCPNCSDSIDSDDSSPLMGPYNEKYESIILCDNYVYSQTPEYITQDTYWGSQKIIDHDIYVENGTTLTIRNTIYMGASTRIIIKPGGRLILGYNAKLTGLCDNMWQGIEVWGDSNADQQLHHGTYYQGYLEMKNGATIENAVCAVELWHPNYWGTTGGIIHATDAIFRNNAKAVHALNYVDHNLNGNEIAYNSQFTKCSFIIDEDYLGTETFFKHVDLANVNSVYFSGCDFSVEPKADGVSPSCMGIGAYGAGFLVKSYCEEPNMHPSCPENDMVKCTFEGFNNGILSINENSQARSFTVRDASFIKNNRGVFIQNTGYATIVRSDFQIGGNSSCGYGIYADGVTGFRIEENSFSPSQGVQCPTYGIGIFNSQGVNDVYLNTFDGLTCANVAYGVNHIADVSGRPPATIPGLTYSCNDNTGNGIDFCVLKDNGSGGIASPQGSATVPAGNTFSGSNYHFYNGGDYEVKYFCKLTGANEIPDPTKMQYVDSDTITCSNDCASHYGNGGVVRSTEEKAALAAIYQSSSDAHERMTAAGDIIRSCLNEDAIDAAVLRQWLGNMHELASDRMAVASYIQEGDFTTALSLAGSLPSTYNLQGDDLSDHNDYMTLLGLYQTLHNSNRTVHEMTSSETDMVKDMAENGLGASQQMARAILMTINDRYIEPYICPDMPRNPDRGTTSGNA